MVTCTNVFHVSADTFTHSWQIRKRRAKKTAINWSATMKGFRMDPAIHIHSSRHSTVSKHKVNKTSVPTHDKVTGVYEYFITSTGVLKKKKKRKTDTFAFVF